MWASVVDRYIEEQLTPEGTLRGVQLAGRLDPTWAQPWFFGILMVPPGAPERQELAAHAAAVHPDVRWFTDQVQR